jgi:lysophospholipase L1-like esterase
MKAQHPVKTVSTLIATLVLTFSHRTSAADQLMIIGDSLSKDHKVEFIALYPDNPKAWDARNWAEILNAERNDRFDLGSTSLYPDLRIQGLEYNFAKPGGTTREYRNFLRQDAAAETETNASSSGEWVWEFLDEWRNTFDDYLLNKSERLVIFLGGNDLALGNSDPDANPVVNGQRRQMDYHTLWNNDGTVLSDPSVLMASIRKNYKSIAQYVRNTRDSDIPTVLVSIPHVGFTPKIQTESPTDPVKTARISAAIETLNAELKTFAQENNIAFADVYPLTKDFLTQPFYIGGVEFSKVPDPDAGPRSTFSGDGFHPSTSMHAKVAQIILDAFIDQLGLVQSRLSDREILRDVLKLDPDLGFQEWLAAENVTSSARTAEADPDGDGLKNLLEFALASTDPTRADTAPIITQLTSDNQLQLRWSARPQASGYVRWRVQTSNDLITWSNSSTTVSMTASSASSHDMLASVPVSPITTPHQFVRLVAQVAP